MGDAIMEAHQQCAVLIDAIEKLRTEAGQGPKVLPPASPDNPLAEELYGKYGQEYREKYLTKGKKERNAALDEFKDEIKKVYLPEGETDPEVHRGAGVGGARRAARAHLPRDHARRHAHRRPRPEGLAQRLGRGRGAAADARHGRVPARRDAGAGGRHARHRRRRAEGRRPAGRVLEEVHARLQLPAVLGRRVQADPRPGPPRDRSRHAGRALAEGGHPAADAVPVHDPARVRDPGVERFVEHGERLRRARWP